MFDRYVASMDCLFCRVVAREVPASVVMETAEIVGFLDIRPVFKGHVLVVPRRHVETLSDLPDALVVPLLTSTRSVAAAMVSALSAQGSFVAMNNVVSQSVPHLHVHVVPRTKGDGLRGFFWPRTRYADEAEQDAYADRLRRALGESAPA
jgi:histidine triad (HIT) family protein